MIEEFPPYWLTMADVFLEARRRMWLAKLPLTRFTADIVEVVDAFPADDVEVVLLERAVVDSLFGILDVLTARYPAATAAMTRMTMKAAEAP